MWPDQGQLTAFGTAQGWSIDALEDGINALQGSLRPDSGAPISVYAMGIDAALFGHNAVYWYTIPSSLQAGTATGWAGYPNWDCDYTLADIPSFAASGVSRPRQRLPGGRR